MKLFSKFALVCATAAAAAMLFAACSKDDDNKNHGDGAITLTGGEPEQTVFADDEISGNGMSFTTTGAWTSDIVETTATRAGAPDWVSIDPDHGDEAGEYTINIILQPNYSGEDRTATITILCGDSSISIAVTQKGTTEEGEMPEVPLISRMTETIHGRIITVQLTYDNQKRVTKIENNGYDGEGTYYTSNYTYTDNQVTNNETYVNSDGPGTGIEELTLGADGYATNYLGQFKMDDETDYSGGDATVFEYMNDHLYKTTETHTEDDGDATPYESTYTWDADGNMTKMVEIGNGDSPETTTVEYTSYPNLTNLAISGDWQSYPAVVGDFYRDRTANLPSKVIFDNETITYAYEMNAAGLPVKITATSSDGEISTIDIVY